MNVGDIVRKKRGYKFPGIVVSTFEKLNGDVRFVVECTSLDCEGLLFIFSPGDLEVIQQAP